MPVHHQPLAVEGAVSASSLARRQLGLHRVAQVAARQRQHPVHHRVPRLEVRLVLRLVDDVQAHLQPLHALEELLHQRGPG